MPWVPPHLVRIFEEFSKRVQFAMCLPYEDELKILLATLNFKEKEAVVKYFFSLDWNISSIKILSMLQSCDLLSATEFLLRQESSENIQLIMNDLLEAEYQLLADFVESLQYNTLHSTRIEKILEDSFSSLISDLIQDNNIVSPSYLTALQNLISDELHETIKRMHIQTILQTNSSTLHEAIRNQIDWQQEINHSSSLWKLLEKVAESKIETLTFLANCSEKQNFQGWKFYIVFFEVIAGNFNHTEEQFLKDYLKECFKSFLKDKSEKIFLKLMLSARAIYHKGSIPPKGYNTWFKTTFGDMKYVVSVTDFKFAMEQLTKLVDYEEDAFFLEIQSNTAISAPPLCNEIVLKYKKICRKKLSTLRTKDFKEPDDVDTFVIDD